jgi:hypothetical protein
MVTIQLDVKDRRYLREEAASLGSSCGEGLERDFWDGARVGTLAGIDEAQRVVQLCDALGWEDSDDDASPFEVEAENFQGFLDGLRGQCQRLIGQATVDLRRSGHGDRYQHLYQEHIAEYSAELERVERALDRLHEAVSGKEVK